MFYENTAPGVGGYFLDSLQADIRSLMLYAVLHETAEGFHRMLAKRFPFAVYYRIRHESVDVYAVLDFRRDPEWIVKRLKSLP